ncbi:MAG: precorrin-4 C(11)-methyltransferase [Myxococcales bacterium]|nr:precorrin-4 C(11)-methyltransferase [Myxococcales bacterium]
MTVYIIGAGPGDPDLITIRGAELIARCPVVLYTGSLVPKAVIERAPDHAQVLDSSGMTLDAIVQVMEDAHQRGQDVARVHTGDPSLFGSTAEQMRRLRRLGIAYEIVPGVSSFAASAAALGKELTLPELSQTVIISRVEGRTPMPEGERLADLAGHGTLVLFLSVTLMKKIVRELLPLLGKDCPVAVVERASWPDQQVVQGTLADIEPKVRKAKIKATAIIIIGQVLTSEDFAESRFYAADFSHRFRRASKD